ncbi:MAG TPA: hypothetical protein VJG90_07255 [Candidatus Nanoarchaeia archaeon]|nr:hypothetical protein [Candidatus Nanoarchaeia archaeon]
MQTRSFHLGPFDPTLEGIMGVWRAEVIHKGSGEVRLDPGQVSRFDPDRNQQTVNLETVINIGVGGQEIRLVEDSLSKKWEKSEGVSIYLWENSALGGVDKNSVTMDKGADAYHLLIVYNGKQSSDPETLLFARDLVDIAATAINSEREARVVDQYTAHGLDINTRQLFTKPFPTMRAVVDEIYDVLKLKPEQDSIVVVKLWNLLKEWGRKVDGWLEDGVLQEGEAKEARDYTRSLIRKDEIRASRGLVRAMADTLKWRAIPALGLSDRVEAIEAYEGRIVHRTADHQLEIGEMADTLYELSRVSVEDPAKPLLRFLSDLWFYGSENELTERHLPSYAEDAVIGLHWLKHEPPTQEGRRLEVLKQYDRMQKDRSIGAGNREIMFKELEELAAEERRVWDQSQRYEPEPKRFEDQPLSLVSLVYRDLDTFRSTRSFLEGYNESNIWCTMSAESIQGLLRLKSVLGDELHADQDLFFDLMFGHLKDGSGQYINPNMHLLERYLRDEDEVINLERVFADSCAGEASEKDRYLSQLNEARANRHAGKLVRASMRDTFCSLDLGARAALAHELANQFYFATGIACNDVDQENPGEGISLARFNDVFLDRKAYQIAKIFSITEKGDIDVDSMFLDEPAQIKVGIAVEVIY